MFFINIVGKICKSLILIMGEMLSLFNGYQYVTLDFLFEHIFIIYIICVHLLENSKTLNKSKYRIL